MWYHGIFKQTGSGAVHLQPIAKALCKPAVQLLLVAPDGGEHLFVRFGAG
jgi:hypothetical protein